jgi:hypothetical protein
MRSVSTSEHTQARTTPTHAGELDSLRRDQVDVQRHETLGPAPGSMSRWTNPEKTTNAALFSTSGGQLYISVVLILRPLKLNDFIQRAIIQTRLQGPIPCQCRHESLQTGPHWPESEKRPATLVAANPARRDAQTTAHFATYSSIRSNGAFLRYKDSNQADVVFDIKTPNPDCQNNRTWQGRKNTRV